MISVDGEQLGIVPTEEALERAQDDGLDLMEVSPNADPPVCRILNFGLTVRKRNQCQWMMQLILLGVKKVQR